MSYKHHHRSKPDGARLFILIFGALAVGIIATAIYYHRAESRQFRHAVELRLANVAAWKVSELEHYRAERVGDGTLLLDNPVFSSLVHRTFFGGPNATAAEEQLRLWLIKYPNYYDYANVLLFDTSGTVRLSVSASQNPIITVDAPLLSHVLVGGKVVFQDFVRAEQNQHIYCSVLVPIYDDTVHARPLGVVVLQIDPNRHLYPLIARWPTQNQTAETLLVRRDGNDVLFLNDIRFRKDTALRLRIPLERTNVAAVKAVRGQVGPIEGVDYRGQPVIAHVAPVPRTPWFLVSRIDSVEVTAPLKVQLWNTIALVVILLLSAGASLGFIWRQRTVRHYREQGAQATELRAVTAHQEVLLATVPDIIVETDERGTCHWANRAALDFFGAEVLGRNVMVNCEGTDIWQRRQDGQMRLLACRRGNLVKDDGRVSGALYSARDITDERSVEQALALRSSIANIFLSLPDHEMYQALLMAILDAASSPRGMLGYLDESGDLIVVASIAADQPQPAKISTNRTLKVATASKSSLWPQAVRDKESRYTNQESRLSHEDKWAHARQICVPIVLRTEVVGLIQAAGRETDYTNDDQEQLETIANYVAPVLHARLLRERREEELRQRNDEMMRFLYAASHDLKSPLVTVSTFLGYLEKDLISHAQPAIDKDIEFIRNAAAKMSQRLDEVLELSRVGRLANVAVEIRLQGIVDEALNLTAGRLSARGVIVQVTDEPLLLYGDQFRLVEIFQNLVDNAVKFMGAQPTPQVTIGVEHTPDGPVLFVQDNGIGIDPRHQGKLFGMFEKLDPHSEGSGMGLALVKRIVEVHGGRIWVESKGANWGTTFRFTLAKCRHVANEERPS